MPILGRNPFGHHNSSSGTHLNEKYTDSNNSSPNKSSGNSNNNINNNNNNNSNNHSHVTQPPIRRSSKSFLSFMSRKPSLESIRSEKSTDSLVNSPTTSHVMNSIQTDSNTTHQHTHNLSHGHMHDNHMSPKPTHSMVELKRFFRSSKILSMTHGHHNQQQQSQQQHHHHGLTSSGGNNNNSSSMTNVPSINRHAPVQKSASCVHNHHPHSTTQLNLNSHFQMTANDHHGHTQSAIPPSSDSILSLSNTINIYHDDTILAQKYGRLGKTLGSGAGGSVKVLVRPSDNATFAVKEFRPRKANESVKQYAKKCTAEFCIGSSLHHPNIVETIDIFSDSNQFKYFQVMEFLPIDFFAVVMTGQMSRGEINCCLKQLCEGVRYLHSMGLAHRDLKLDNCCMTEQGILKIIDFGSAVVFKYPFEDEHKTHNAHGIVGSDPYLAPEVITSTKSYDPQAVDVWSIGIIFCCMMLKRFPWKAPKLSDDNFKLYTMPDDIERDYEQSAKHHEQLLSERRKHREKLNHPQLNNNDDDENNNDNENETKTKQEETVIPVKQLPTPENDTDKTTAPDHLNTVPESTTREIMEDEQQQQPQQNNEKTTPEQNNEEPKIKHDEQNNKHTTNAPAVQLQHNDTAQETKSISSSRTNATAANQHQHSSSNGHPHKRVIHGPYRLLRLLPHASRPILSKILEIDPSKRATLDQVFEDNWFADIPSCTMDKKNNVIRAHGHHHTIVKDGKTFKI
ncbi:serine/threonine protein kinase [Maudiozyma exigua]|uniref:non-specific serine/threonine protein kinase n=1 Tax=Maudiozyma exigua TaxID=34358 RepID=A0A9P6WFD3_MAUEX|nr:serine/threonine protein kinase [Kazachstania exigua]